MKPLRIVFAGTPDFAVPALRALLESPHEVCAVYTQPDRPAGRGRKLTASPVKQCAQEFTCTVEQPLSLKDEAAQQQLASFDADVIVVVAYGLILPKVVLEAPRYGCLNIHASLLPRWRGAAPIQRAILAGDERTGITIMQMGEGLDTGDMLHTVETPISGEDTTPALHDRLSQIGSEAIMCVLSQLRENALRPIKQNDSDANYAEKLQKSEARIEWSLSAVQLHRCVRAFVPWPVAETDFSGQRLRVWEAELSSASSDQTPGTVISESKRGIDVATGDGVLRLLRVQLPGGKPLTAQQFIAAHSLVGHTLT